MHAGEFQCYSVVSDEMAQTTAEFKNNFSAVFRPVSEIFTTKGNEIKDAGNIS
jgi:hypothetical protein